ncbi:MAG: leucine-rich repeat domain-containing protein, partial [Prevotella sp.]
MKKAVLIIMALVALNVTNADAKKFHHYGNTLTFLCDDETMTAEVVGTYHVETSGTITVPETFVAKDGNTYTVTAIGDNFLYFDGCPYSAGCTEVVLPKTIKSIGKRAFVGIEAESINLPEGLESIGEAAFWGCSNLQLAELPSTLKHLGKLAFWGCSSITISSLPASIETLGSGVFGGTMLGGQITSFTFPEHLTELPDSMFMRRSGLEELHLPSTLKKIGKYVITGTDLTELVIPESVTEIAERAFSGSWSLTTAVLPKSMTKIPAGAFANTGIKNLDFLHEGITEIGDEAFQGSDLVE